MNHLLIFFMNICQPIIKHEPPDNFFQPANRLHRPYYWTTMYLNLTNLAPARHWQLLANTSLLVSCLQSPALVFSKIFWISLDIVLHRTTKVVTQFQSRLEKLRSLAHTTLSKDNLGVLNQYNFPCAYSVTNLRYLYCV